MSLQRFAHARIASPTCLLPMHTDSLSPQPRPPPPKNKADSLSGWNATIGSAYSHHVVGHKTTCLSTPRADETASPPRMHARYDQRQRQPSILFDVCLLPHAAEPIAVRCNVICLFDGARSARGNRGGPVIRGGHFAKERRCNEQQPLGRTSSNPVARSPVTRMLTPKRLHVRICTVEHKTLF